MIGNWAFKAIFGDNASLRTKEDVQRENEESIAREAATRRFYEHARRLEKEDPKKLRAMLQGAQKKI